MGAVALSATPRNDAAQALSNFESATRNLDYALIQRIKNGACTKKERRGRVVKAACVAWEKYCSLSGNR